MFTKDSIKQFLKSTRKRVLVLLFFVAFILVYIYFFVIQCTYSYGIGKVYYCFILNKSEGKPCYKKTDCGEGQKCLLEGANMMPGLEEPYSYKKRWLKDTYYKNGGVCRTNESIGCNTEVNEDGSIGATGCSDPF